MIWPKLPGQTGKRGGRSDGGMTKIGKDVVMRWLSAALAVRSQADRRREEQ